MDFFDKINVGVLMGLICILVGLVMLLSLRGFFIFHPVRCLRILSPHLSDRSRRRSLTLALAGTLGVGNIYGVAVGIIIGGAGSIFWLFVSAVFALVIKYSECVMALEKSSGQGRGMMGVLPATFKKAGLPLAKIYAVLMLVLSLLMGSFIQADSLISSVVNILPISRISVAVILLILVAIVVARGGEKIKSATEIIIPFVTVAYVALGLFIILKNISGIGGAFARIFSSAFNFKSMLLGIFPTVNITAFSEGFARGVLSNEAGVGTSAVAHTAEITPQKSSEKNCASTEIKPRKSSEKNCVTKEEKADPPPRKNDPSAMGNCKNPTSAEIGLFGMCEIIFDTLILCMLTGFMILLAVENPESYSSPMSLVFHAVRQGAGEFALPILLVSIFFFAYSTIICWYYYGGECVAYLGLSRYKSLYLFIFLIFIIFAAFVDTYLALWANDVVLLLMSLPTAAAILKNRGLILKSTVDSGLLRASHKKKKRWMTAKIIPPKIKKQ